MLAGAACAGAMSVAAATITPAAMAATTRERAGTGATVAATETRLKDQTAVRGRGETKSKPIRKGTVMQPGGQPDMSALLAQAQQVQQQLMEAQEALANSEVHGQAGGGLVQVTMKGSGEVIAVAIDPKVVDPDDVETLQDLIVGAIGDASKQVTILAHDRLGPLAGGMGNLGIPGL
jgi:DNA-binding YbaB/EbfC family protein